VLIAEGERQLALEDGKASFLVGVDVRLEHTPGDVFIVHSLSFASTI
jgi:hypothetical protein